MIKFQQVTAFFDSKAVISRLDPATRKFLGWAGGLTRKIARRSLTQARQKKLSEMTDDEKAAYEKRVEYAQKNGLPKPRRPEVSSEPGEPPKLHDKQSPLKRLLYYGLDLKNKAAVVGPERAKSGIADVLEHGGTVNGHEIEARPFVGPALDKVKPQMSDFWKDLVS